MKTKEIEDRAAFQPTELPPQLVETRMIAAFGEQAQTSLPACQAIGEG